MIDQSNSPQFAVIALCLVVAIPGFAAEESSLEEAFNDDFRVEGFLEKPKTKAELDLVRTSPEWIDSRGIQSHGRDCLASMGIYLFNRKTLIEMLDKTT